MVNSKPTKPSYALQENDKVESAPGFIIPDATMTQILPNPEIKLNIIHEDNNILVINKPAGIAVHPRQDKNHAPLASEILSTLVSELLAHYPPLAEVGDDPAIRPGIVHRLDKDTSGVMIIAKNQFSFDWLKKQFQDRLAQKKYLALVNGIVKNDAGIIDQPLARSQTDPTKQKISADGKPAITEYKVRQRFKDYTLLEVLPRTGRLHQIRVHLNFINHPVVGDKKYGPGHRLLPFNLSRQFLHAAELKIILPASMSDEPNNQEKTFVAPLPKDLSDTLETLEKTKNM
ncbi:MAG: Pseudouridine synthase [Parcubacteria group bacterium GW2011_GWA2_42_11]|nr:MAG: Pseudouridine synthase [Parcubacteria group bacterium GW2011_GWA2_42_11]